MVVNVPVVSAGIVKVKVPVFVKVEKATGSKIARATTEVAARNLEIHIAKDNNQAQLDCTKVFLLLFYSLSFLSLMNPLATR